MFCKISIIVEKDGDGYYAYCPQLPGCQSQGNSLSEITLNMQEAIELYLSTLSEAEKQQLLSQEKLTMSLEVKIS